MERNVLIPQISFRNWNKAEKVNFLLRYMSKLPSQRTEGDDGFPEIHSDEITDIESLNISAEQIRQLQEIVDKLRGLTLQTRASNETAQMQEIDTQRTTVGKYIVNRILKPEALPMEKEREAAEKMYVEILPYKNFHRLPVGQKSAIIDGLLVDTAKSEYAESISTLALTEPIAELQRLNEEYEKLESQRSSKKNIKSETVTAAELSSDAEILVNNMNDFANATTLLEPNEEASAFVREIIKLYDNARKARNMRDSVRDDEDEDDNVEGDGGNADDDLPVVQ